MDAFRLWKAVVNLSSLYLLRNHQMGILAVLYYKSGIATCPAVYRYSVNTCLDPIM